MLLINFKKIFIKKFKKLSPKIRSKFNENLKIFEVDFYNPALNNHALNGKYLNCRSINATGDIRAIYKMQANNVALFVYIDNHSNLYK